MCCLGVFGRLWGVPRCVSVVGLLSEFWVALVFFESAWLCYAVFVGPFGVMVFVLCCVVFAGFGRAVFCVCCLRACIFT